MQFDSQLEQLREKFTADLPNRFQEVRNLYQELVVSGNYNEAFGSALHRLAGLAGIFKAHRISELARNLEIHYNRNQTEASRETQKIIAILFRQLEEAVHDYLAQPIPREAISIRNLSANKNQKTICLIEDDPADAIQIATVLEENGYRVDIRQSLASCADFVHKSQILPSLIIIAAEFVTPASGGSEIFSRLKEQFSDFPPIILTSTSSDTVSRINALRTGASEYLVKPLGNAELVNVVEKYLKGSVSHKILIVDDDAISADYIAHVIQCAGMQPMVLTDPLRTFEVLTSFKPDLLILDIYMPGCNGIELAQIIRQCCCYNLMPIMFLTTGTDIDQELIALSSGGDELIRKTESNEHILKKIASRLRRLDQIRSLNEQLHREKQRSERLRKSQNDFLAYVVHELKSPLHVILGFSDLMKMDEQLSPEQAEIVDEIIRGGQTLLNTIEDLSEQVKIASGKLALNIENFNIIPLLTQAISDASLLGLQSEISVQSDFAIGQPLQIQADHRRVGQILNNLLSNAIKYNKPNGKVWVSLQTRSNGMLRINIFDTGIGIARENLDYVFEAFERFSTQQNHIEGTGIGLSICRQLIALMSGNIGVSSELNVGSQFWIELPLAQEQPLSS